MHANRAKAVKIGQISILPTLIMAIEVIGMESKRQRSHEDAEAQKLVKRIERTQASQEAAREAETKRTLDDYARKVGS